MSEKKGVFEALNAINVNDHIDTKKTGNATLSYLSWPWAISEVMKRYPDMTYTIERFDGGKPYIEDENLGYLVMTSITVSYTHLTLPTTSRV